MPSKATRSSNAYTGVNRVKIVRGGGEYFSELLQLISKAKESVHIQIYIFDDDDTGQLVADALKGAVKRNVHVFVMADGYASQSLSRSFINAMVSSGIHFRFFEPVFKSRYFYFGRRMHHKLVVADGQYALVGGINIANRYNDLPGKPAWLDFALLVEGDVARQLCILCWKTWNGFPQKLGITPCEEKPATFSIPPAGRSEVRMRRNDWVRGKNEISASYIEMLRGAKSEVTILCSYFLPGKIIRKLMVKAIRRGVTIRVIAAGTSDIMMAKDAERWLYNWLLRVGVELYEYQKNILHGKVAVCDNQWMTVGSYNINNISAYASIELNLDVRDPVFSTEVRHMLQEIIVADCIRITAEHHTKTNNIAKQFWRWFSYQFIRVVFYLFTFYFKRHR